MLLQKNDVSTLVNHRDRSRSCGMLSLKFYCVDQWLDTTTGMETGMGWITKCIGEIGDGCKECGDRTEIPSPCRPLVQWSQIWFNGSEPVWLGLPGGRFQSDGGLRITAATARWWSSSGALHYFCTCELDNGDCVLLKFVTHLHKMGDKSRFYIERYRPKKLIRVKNMVSVFLHILTV